jgi:hydrogenase maturation factor
MSSEAPSSPTAQHEVGVPAEDLATASLAMARRFRAGATLWCVSPSWPHHARHVAVEFVHPVIVGKPALPSLIGPSEDPVAGLRASVDVGDLVLAIGDVDDDRVVDLMRRAHAWGVETIWIGAGARRPPAGAADHVLWLDEQQSHAPHDGRFILVYHLLWELTHVCLEHRGRLQEPEAVCEGEVCITCSDEGILAEVVEVDGLEARVRTAEGPRTVDVTVVGDVAPTDLLLVHAGAAIARLDGEVVA